MAHRHPEVTLNDDARLLVFGVGLYKVPGDDVAAIVDDALGLGYRLFDTAAMYGNEQALGQSLRSSGVNRAELQVTSKVLNTDHGYEEARAACYRSLELLNLDYLDFYLIHWPAPTQNRFVETWHAFEALQREGVVRSIGVSNFHTHHLDRLRDEAEVVPALNQVECHPWLPQNELIDEHTRRGIATQAWSPLARGRILTEPALVDLARKHDASPAQVALAWQLDRGVAVIPKTMSRERLVDNARALDLALDDEDRALIARLESGVRTGVDPDDRD